MTTPTRHAFTVDEWHRMGDAGLFDEDSRVELLEGEVVEMSPIGDGHIRCVDRLTRLLLLTVGDRAVVSVQNPIRLDNVSEPQPDLTLLRPPPEAPRPAPARDVLLAVEVADTTLAWDRDRKAPLYGRSGILQTWVVDLVGEEVLVLGDPSADGYLSLRRARRGDTVAIEGLPGLSMAVDDILGPASRR